MTVAAAGTAGLGDQRVGGRAPPRLQYCILHCRRPPRARPPPFLATLRRDPAAGAFRVGGRGQADRARQSNADSGVPHPQRTRAGSARVPSFLRHSFHTLQGLNQKRTHQSATVSCVPVPSLLGCRASTVLETCRTAGVYAPSRVGRWGWRASPKLDAEGPRHRTGFFEATSIAAVAVQVASRYVAGEKAKGEMDGRVWSYGGNNSFARTKGMASRTGWQA